MATTITREKPGIWRVCTSLFEFSRFFKNWKDVWGAYRTRAPLPPMVLINGLTLEHNAADDAIRLFREAFVKRRFTGSKFYTPRCGDVVVDLGGEIGFFALSLEWMARGVRVHTFEHAADQRKILKKNVATNRLAPFITVYPFVVGVAKKAEAELQTAGKSGLAALKGRQNSSFSMLDILPTLTLTEAIDITGAASVELLKVDSAGNEVTILEAADDETWAKIRRVVIKYHEDLVPDSLPRLIEILEDQGFGLIETIPDRKHRGVGLIRAARER